MQGPLGYEGSVAHVGFFIVRAFLDAYCLGEQAIHNICIVTCLVGLHIWNKAKVEEFLICYVIQGKKVCTGFFYGVAVGLQGILADSWQEFPATMSEAFMKIGMQTVTLFAIFAYHGDCIGIGDKFLKEATLL